MKRLAVLALVAGVAGCASARMPDVAGLRTADAAPIEAAPRPASDGASLLASIPTRAQGGDQEEVLVTAPRPRQGAMAEDRLVGSNEQPEWTTERRFATTRAYVIAPGQIEFEQWMKLQTPRGSAPNHFWQTEIGMGFEGGWQLDLYENYGHPPGGPTKHDGVQFEARYALGKWGSIPANPTLYAEYKANHDAPDAVEAKVLLADDLCGTPWHWALNAFWEQETSGLRATEVGAAGGLSYSLADSAFAVGAEAKFERVTEIGTMSHPAHELLAGPSFQWRPTENTHLDLVPLFGLTRSDRADPRLEVYLVFGIDFGPEREGRSGPTSSRSR